MTVQNQILLKTAQVEDLQFIVQGEGVNVILVEHVGLETLVAEQIQILGRGAMMDQVTINHRRLGVDHRPVEEVGIFRDKFIVGIHEQDGAVMAMGEGQVAYGYHTHILGQGQYLELGF